MFLQQVVMVIAQVYAVETTKVDIHTSWTLLAQSILLTLGMTQYYVCPQYVFLLIKQIKLKDIQNLDGGTLKKRHHTVGMVEYSKKRHHSVGMMATSTAVHEEKKDHSSTQI